MSKTPSEKPQEGAEGDAPVKIHTKKPEEDSDIATHPPVLPRVYGQVMLTQLLGRGSYGYVCKGLDTRTHQTVAVKAEYTPVLLPREIRVYKLLWAQKNKGFAEGLHIARVLWHSADGDCDDSSGGDEAPTMLVLERLGPSLDRLYDRMNRRWSAATLLWTVARILELLKELHGAGIIHRDVKPDNFAIGFGEDDRRARLYVLDFGLSRQYITANGDHAPPLDADEAHLSIVGTMRYASVRNHRGEQQSRRDDLESLVYMAAYFWSRTLPWLPIMDDSNATQAERSLRVREIKEQEDTRAFLRAQHPLLASLHSYTRELAYEDRPDYVTWIQRFDDAAESVRGDAAPVPDWIMEAHHVKQRRTCRNPRRKSSTYSATHKKRRHHARPRQHNPHHDTVPIIEHPAASSASSATNELTVAEEVTLVSPRPRASPE